MRFAAINRLSVNKAVSRCCRHRTRLMRVSIVEVVDCSVVDNRGVADNRVRDVHVADVGVAMAIPGTEWFPKTQREPSHTVSKATAKAEAYAPAAAKESDESWAIDRRSVNGSWAPAPSAADVRPAAVMVGSKTPR